MENLLIRNVGLFGLCQCCVAPRVYLHPLADQQQRLLFDLHQAGFRFCICRGSSVQDAYGFCPILSNHSIIHLQ